MLLKSLELHGFKTFPDKTVLKFEKGITSVVGPNGSGKSNISDAMRWVLGEQSLRVLRCSKMEDVVFSGTPQRKAQGYAEVTLNIENSDRRLPFDQDLVSVTRRYYRSGESEYMINKTIVRLKDINELFMDTGLGRDGYSIIGQGKIDSIVAARSEDRREIFEEASGISRYRYRKEESERRLLKTEDNLVRLRDIFAELESRVDPLRAQAEKAEQFIALDTEKRELEIGIWVETLNQSAKILREHSEKIDIVESHQRLLIDEEKNLGAKIDQNISALNETTAQMEFARIEAARLDEAAIRTDGEISVAMNDISHHGLSLERLQAQIELLAASEKEIEEEIRRQNERALEAQRQVDACRKRLDVESDKLNAFRARANDAGNRIEATAADLARVHSAISGEQVAKSSALSSIAEIEHRAGAVEESISKNKEKQLAIEQEEQQLVQMLNDLNNEIIASENAIKGHDLRLQGRNKRMTAAKELADRLQLDANEQKRRAKLLGDLERNLEGFAHSVKAVMKESRRGVLRGVYGPVTSVLKVTPAYAVALETALGGAMQHIVVETEADAKQAIAFLKKTEAGRATFLPRTAIKGNSLNDSSLETMMGFVGIASTLCTCDERFLEIKASLLGRVVVAEDLDCAVAIAKRTNYRYRIVSLDGQVVNPGGSLTGGAKARNSGLLSRNVEITRISQKAEKLEAEAQQAIEAFRIRQIEVVESEAALQTERAERSAKQEERIKITAELHRAVRERQNAQAEEEALIAERQDTGKRIAALQSAVSGAEEKLVALKVELEQIRDAGEQLSAQRDEINRMSESATAHIQEIRMAEFAFLRDLETATNAVKEMERRKLDGGESIVKLNEEYETLIKLRQTLNERVEILRNEAKTAREEAERTRRRVSGLAESRATLEQEAGALRGKEKDIAAQKEKIGQELARLQERLEHAQQEFDAIIRMLWDEYELTRREAEQAGAQIQDISKAQRRLNELKMKIKALGSVNVGAVVEYKEVAERYRFMKEQIADIENAKAELMKLINELTKQMREQFTQRFALINQHFTSIFRELFGGGTAELSLSNDTDALNSGIDIMVQPPGKIVKHIESLSGGEKALVAISIYFAIMKVSPPPFCVLDEIEAALDDVNVSRFAQYLRRMSRESQFIVITHRRGTMEASDMLYGVTMQDEGISKLLTLKTQAEAEQVTKGESG